MIAVIETGGKQYTVTGGDVLTLEKLPGKVGDTVSFSRVLLTSDGNDTHVGTPFLDTAVLGKIVEHGRGEKIRIFVMKAKKRHSRRQGHRQEYTRIEIVSVAGKEGKKERPEVKKIQEKPAKVAKTKETSSKTKKPSPKTITKGKKSEEKKEPKVRKKKSSPTSKKAKKDS